MTYAEARAYIASLSPRGWRLGLDRMAEFARRIGVSDALGQAGGPQFLHVAGTNGKGSVTAYTQTILKEAGYRAGGFFSPFVYDFRERVQLDCELIGKEALSSLTQRLKPIADSFDGSEFDSITEFEFKTGLGLLLWKEAGCDWVALEVGLGGRLDATNIVTPAACAIVSIGLDHIAILGDTRAQIATEKAGILKPGVPAILGSLDPEAMEAVRFRAREVGAGELYAVGREIDVWGQGREAGFATPWRRLEGLTPGIVGTWQAHNSAIASALVDAGLARAGVPPLSDEVVRRGIEKTRLPGRFELVPFGGGVAVFDGGHNVDAANSIARTFCEQFPEKRAVLVWGMNQGHEPTEFLSPLAGVVESVFAAPLDFYRTFQPAELVVAARSLGLEASAYATAGDAVEAALEGLGDRVLLVAGSFYLLGPARERLATLGTGRPQ